MTSATGTKTATVLMHDWMYPALIHDWMNPALMHDWMYLALMHDWMNPAHAVLTYRDNFEGLPPARDEEQLNGNPKGQSRITTSEDSS